MKFAVIQLPFTGRPSDYGNGLSASRVRPIFGWLGLRPVLAQHTRDEHAALERWATGRTSIVEIGVAEGVSAMAMRSKMAADGNIYLIDPFHLSKNSILNFTKWTAHRMVASVARGNATWIQDYSHVASRLWKTPIDLLLIDGDHTEAGVRRDWVEWNQFVVPGGLVIFHDARLFDGGWTTSEYGPVKLTEELLRGQGLPGWKVVDQVHSLIILQREK